MTIVWNLEELQTLLQLKKVQYYCIDIAWLFWYYIYFFQGANASQLEKEIGSDQFPINEHYFGLVNVSKYY